MDLWMILSKLALIVYIAFYSVIHEQTGLSWIIFSLLLYSCINISLYIVKKQSFSLIIICLSLSIIIFSAFVFQPAFLILLPLSVLELASYFIRNKWLLFIIAFLPIFYVPKSLQLIFGLLAIFSFLVYTIASLYINRLSLKENQIDKMRKDIQRLTKGLNENKEYIVQSEYTFKLEERNRISQEIHDKIGHSMTGALIQMEAAKQVMKIDQEKALELLQNAITISKDGIESIRLTLKNMKPPTEQMGVHQMKLFIDEFAVNNPDIKTVFVYKGKLDIITPIQWKIIHENVTEALTNTMKYANASKVAIDIHVMNKMIKIQVKDNGKGIEKIKKGLGIVGMEERTASINGKVIVDGMDGFSVTTLLPI